MGLSITLKPSPNTNFSLGFPNECVTAVICPNKSETKEIMDAIAGSAPLKVGEIRFRDRQESIRTPDFIKHVGYVPRQPEVIAFWTIERMAQFLATWYDSWNWDDFHLTLERFSIKAKHPIKSLSTGRLRLLWFAYATAYDPDILLLDSPTKDLDSILWGALRTELLRFMERPNKIAIITDRDFGEVQRLADIITFINDHKVLGSYEKDSLFDQWKTLWLDKQPPHNLPGVISTAQNDPTQILTSSFQETKNALEKLDIEIFSCSSMSLEEIYIYLRDERSSTHAG